MMVLMPFSVGRTQQGWHRMCPFIGQLRTWSPGVRLSVRRIDFHNGFLGKSTLTPLVSIKQSGVVSWKVVQSVWQCIFLALRKHLICLLKLMLNLSCTILPKGLLPIVLHLWMKMGVFCLRVTVLTHTQQAVV